MSLQDLNDAHASFYKEHSIIELTSSHAENMQRQAIKIESTLIQLIHVYANLLINYAYSLFSLADLLIFPCRSSKLLQENGLQAPCTEYHTQLQ